jgi:hypothetical protein
VKDFSLPIIHPAEYFYGFTFSGSIANLIPVGFTVHGRSSDFYVGEKQITMPFLGGSRSRGSDLAAYPKLK